MPSLSEKEWKRKFNTDDLIFRNKFSLPSETQLPAEYNSAQSFNKQMQIFWN